jgi:predicted O-methyltransferase YrrM
MDVAARTMVVEDQHAGRQRLAIAGFRLTAADRVAAVVAELRYPPARFEHYGPRWSGITGWLSTRQGARLFDLARTIDAPGEVVEIGCAFGRSTIALALGARAGGGGKVYAVDPHTGGIGLVERYGPLARTFSSLGPFLENIVRFGVQEIVVPVTLTSMEAATAWPQRAIRLLFIDGWHDRDACRNDLRAWTPWVSPGGALVIHDYDWPEVRRAVGECLPQLPDFGPLDAEDPNMAIVRRDRA